MTFKELRNATDIGWQPSVCHNIIAMDRIYRILVTFNHVSGTNMNNNSIKVKTEVKA